MGVRLALWEQRASGSAWERNQRVQRGGLRFNGRRMAADGRGWQRSRSRSGPSDDYVCG